MFRNRRRFRRITIIFFALSILIPPSLYSQDSLYRLQYPHSAIIGIEGIGSDFVLGNHFGMNVTTWILHNTMNIRWYVIEKNISPFIGAGAGQDFGGHSSSANSWMLVFAGYELSDETLMMQVIIQYPIVSKSPEVLKLNSFNLNLGYRIQ